MIVVDSNIVAYLYLPTEFTDRTERLLAREPNWAAPTLWQSELRNVLALYMRRNLLDLEQALEIQTDAETLFSGAEYHVPSLDVLNLVTRSECSAYDCEFVALARLLHTRLVTEDRKLLEQFPDVACSLSDAIA